MQDVEHTLVPACGSISLSGLGVKRNNINNITKFDSIGQYVDNKGFAEALYNIKAYADKLAGNTVTSYTNNVAAVKNEYLDSAGAKIAIQKVKDYIDSLVKQDVYITEILTGDGASATIYSEDSEWEIDYDFLVIKPKNFTASDLGGVGYDGSKVSVQLIKTNGNSNPESSNGQAYKVIIKGTGETSGSISIGSVHNHVNGTISYAAELVSKVGNNYIGIVGSSYTNTASKLNKLTITCNVKASGTYTVKLEVDNSNFHVYDSNQGNSGTTNTQSVTCSSSSTASITAYWAFNGATTSSSDSTTITASLINSSNVVVATNKFTVGYEI